MQKYRYLLMIVSTMLAVEAFLALSEFGIPRASAQTVSEREKCAESVGIATRQDGRNDWIHRNVPWGTHNAYTRCVEEVAARKASRGGAAR